MLSLTTGATARRSAVRSYNADDRRSSVSSSSVNPLIVVISRIVYLQSGVCLYGLC